MKVERGDTCEFAFTSDTEYGNSYLLVARLSCHLTGPDVWM